MMDIKHLCRQKLLEFDGERYRGVTAVTYDKEHFDKALNQAAGRPQLLAYGNINKLLTTDQSDDAKRLRDAFPFRGINLDYTNSLFASKNTTPLSEHLAAIESIIDRQDSAGMREFVLLLTTRAEQSPKPAADQMAGEFLDELVVRVDDNCKHNPDFQTAFQGAFKGDDGAKVLKKHYRSFVPIGVTKLLAELLAKYQFEIIDVKALNLCRDEESPSRWLLHFAFHIRRGTPPRSLKLKEYGLRVPYFFERQIAPFVAGIGRKGPEWISELRDRARLQKALGGYVAELAGMTLDLKIPEPKRRE